MRCLSENAGSGIYVSESLSSGQPIPVRRDTVVAFIGAAPRGPVGMPVAIHTVGEYLKRFGVAGCEHPLLETIRQYFSNGGVTAIVVRVCSSDRRHRITFPGPEGSLTLEALNPGAREILRASIDYDGIETTDVNRFNLVIHRLESRDRPIIEQQEVYRAVSVDLNDNDYVGYALAGSELVCIRDRIPDRRPDKTFRAGIDIGASYIYVDPDWPETGELTDYDLIGCRTEGTGLFALDQMPSVDLLAVIPDTPDLGPVAMFAAERYCRERNALLLIDPPSAWRGLRDALQAASHSQLTSPNMAMYFPRPAKVGRHTASALGEIAGALAARDSEQPYWGLTGARPLELRGCGLPTFELTSEEQLLLRNHGINSLVFHGPSRSWLTGLVTLNRGAGCMAEWDRLQLRRITLKILDSVSRGTRWAALQTNDPDTRHELYEQLQHYLRDLYAAGVLADRQFTDAGYVYCEEPGEDEQGSGVIFEFGFMPRGHGMQRYRCEQLPAECRIRNIHIEHPVALAG